MSSTLKIHCVNLGEYIPVEGGESLEQIYRRVAPRIGFRPICARVNNKTEGLRYCVYSPKMVEFLDPAAPTSERVYIRSLCMVLYKAVNDLCPGARLRIEHSVAGGYFCHLAGAEVTPELIGELRAGMKRIIDADMPFMRYEELTADAIRRFRDQGLDDKVLLLETLHNLYTVFYSLDGLCDSYYSALAPSTGVLGVFGLEPYFDGMLLLGPDRADRAVTAPVRDQKKMFRAFMDHVRFNSIIGVRNVGELNRAVDDRASAMIINIAEALHNKSIASIADTIAGRYAGGGARIVLVAGPSSSGKTTFTKRLAVQLLTNLLQPRMISLDDYFVNRDRTPHDENGDYDYESLYALDLERFNADLKTLLEGGEVELPYYNFERGEREFRGNRIRLEPNNVLLIEGIHGLNPELTAMIPEEMKFRVYVSALTSISIDDHNWIPTTDNRLLRRIIRDNKYRGVSALDTIRRWPSVRRGEERWIFPYQENADVMFNSSLLFELGVMKERGEAILESVPRDVPEYAEAYRLRKFLSYFAPIPETYIPSTSLLREFLGGSSFHY
ncbi:MAG: nucleoside kinase [Clostridium sp.]|nr:nucleoside kinase [Clostridium sp.]